MKDYFKNLSTKDKILLAATLIILLIIGALLIYNSRQSIVSSQDGAIVEESIEFHDLSDPAPLDENIE